MIKGHLKNKRDEIVWALSNEDQGYSGGEIALMFNMPRSSVYDIIKKKPEGWKPKWVKQN